ncbi:unnamed protein product [Symbiodinium natans]|uniref:Uncharacterized protein n=1 Tax=Symbiodinium natans TaxID=878477 RepID=A0A812MRB7_9DINO|nr:unnamed protein product [Symbiodinium natans]
MTAMFGQYGSRGSLVLGLKTHDTTQKEGSYNRLRREWFVMYLSSEALEPSHQGCRNLAPASAEMAQVVMRPEFYDKNIEKMNLWVSVIGEAGGAFGLAQTGFFGLYLLLWYTQYGAKKLEGDSVSRPYAQLLQAIVRTSTFIAEFVAQHTVLEIGQAEELSDFCADRNLNVADFELALIEACQQRQWHQELGEHQRSLALQVFAAGATPRPSRVPTIGDTRRASGSWAPWDS